MSFKQKVFLDEAIIPHLEKLTRLKIKTVEIVFQAKGSSGKVHQVIVTDESNKKHFYVVKQSENSGEFEIYKKLLEPYHLNSPKMYGLFNLNNNLFLLME